MGLNERMRKALAGAALALLLGACASPSPEPQRPERALSADELALLERLTWGANASSARQLASLGAQRWIERQLAPPPGDDLPPELAAQVKAMTVSQVGVRDLAERAAARRREVRNSRGSDGAREAQQANQRELSRLAREAMTRSALRAVYSPWQLREQMTWFWANHFSVFAGKAELRVYLADWEESAIRPHALGRFRELLGATARHPAMLRYLDNAQNRAGHLNENYARELMELHTLGVDAGYTQQDVQELARVLTGHALFRFYHASHDAGPKTLLGEPVRASGEAELDEALDRLARHPATARFVSRKLAVFFVGDEPSPALVERMSAEWRRTDGEIAAVLRVVFASPEFKASLGRKFKDPVHYVYSAVRLAWDEQPIAEPERMLFWIGRLGEPLYLRPTPDGWPLAGSAWSSPEQMAARFEVARAIGYAAPAPAAMRVALSDTTSAALGKASSPRERNFLLFASP